MASKSASCAGVNQPLNSIRSPALTLAWKYDQVLRIRTDHQPSANVHD